MGQLLPLLLPQLLLLLVLPLLPMLVMLLPDMLLLDLLLLDMPLLLPLELLMLPPRTKTSGCAIQSDCLPVHCSNCFCSEGSFFLSFSGLAALIPPTLIRGKPGKLVYLEMHNFN